MQQENVFQIKGLLLMAEVRDNVLHKLFYWTR